MKNFTLTLFAKRRSDGSYDYSLKVWENRSTGNLAATVEFESPALINQQLEAVLPVGGDTVLTPAPAESAEEYWYPFTMPMSEAQAANLGWRSESSFDQTLLN